MASLQPCLISIYCLIAGVREFGPPIEAFGGKVWSSESGVETSDWGFKIISCMERIVTKFKEGVNRNGKID